MNASEGTQQSLHFQTMNPVPHLSHDTRECPFWEQRAPISVSFSEKPIYWKDCFPSDLSGTSRWAWTFQSHSLFAHHCDIYPLNHNCAGSTEAMALGEPNDEHLSSRRKTMINPILTNDYWNIYVAKIAWARRRPAAMCTRTDTATFAAIDGLSPKARYLGHIGWLNLITLSEIAQFLYQCFRYSILFPTFCLR
jgi:hypothetical protein